jgi:hypothetical protein
LRQGRVIRFEIDLEIGLLIDVQNGVACFTGDAGDVW